MLFSMSQAPVHFSFAFYVTFALWWTCKEELSVQNVAQGHFGTKIGAAIDKNTDMLMSHSHTLQLQAKGTQTQTHRQADENKQV